LGFEGQIYKSMKHLQSFQLFEAHASALTPEQEDFLNKITEFNYGVWHIESSWSVNPETGLVDVKSVVMCSYQGLKNLKGISFGHVSGDFLCNNNQLTSLEGSPRTVSKNFHCSKNQLTSLEGAPRTVGGNFHCYNNQLTTLEGAPQTVGGDFHCYNNQLTSLVGAPQTVDGRFSCDAFGLGQGEWNPSGWGKILTIGNGSAREFILTLPYLDPAYWLELHRSNRKKFNDIWMGYRQDPEVRKTALFQEVEAALSGRALKNLEDLQDLKDFGL